MPSRKDRQLIPRNAFASDRATGIFTTAHPVQSVAEYVSLVTSLRRNPARKYPRRPILYRGQGRIEDALLPKIARRDYLLSLRDERYLLDEFKRRSFPYLPSYAPDLTDIEWLGLARHYGLATRLLDWTESALTALWFSVDDSRRQHNSNNAVVWILLPEDADFLSGPEMKQSPFSFRSTRVFMPRYYADRIKSQAGWFTVHPYHPERNFVPLNENRRMKSQLRCVHVSPRYHSQILLELAQCGITAATVFPDLGGLCAYLNESVRQT